MSEVFTNAKRDAEDLSKVVNQTSGTITNRTGTNIRPLPVVIADIEAQGQAAIANTGWFAASGSFEDGGTITERNQYLQLVSDAGADVAGGYSWGGALPKVVAPGSAPATTGGTGADAWVYRGDTTVRAALADGSADIGGVGSKKLLISVESVKELALIPKLINREYKTTSFWPESSIGGGSYRFNPLRAKADHNGGSVIDPDKLSELGANLEFNTYFTAAASGSGCFELITSKVEVAHFGALPAAGDVLLPMQKAIDSLDEVYASGGIYDIELNAGNSGIGLTFRSNTKVVFEVGAGVKVLPNNLDFYIAAYFLNVDNVRLVNPLIIGDKDEHTGITGEFGNLVSLYSATNIVLENPTLEGAWGDGIYMGSNSAEDPTSLDIVGLCTINNCRRQGVSVVNCDRFTADILLISNVSGTPPAAGIDFEPNNLDQRIKNVRIKNLITSNTASGLLIDLRKLETTSELVDIQIDNFIDDLSTYGVIATVNGDNCPGGNITIGTAKTNKTDLSGLRVRRWSRLAPTLRIGIAEIIDANESNAGHVDGAPVSFLTSAGESIGFPVGNIYIDNLNIIKTASSPSTLTEDISIRDVQNNSAELIEIKNVASAKSNLLDAASLSTINQRKTVRVSRLGDVPYSQGNIVGTVFDSSGAPAGAIIESGVVGNSRYVKFASGDLININFFLGTRSINTPLGAAFVTSSIDMGAYAAPFVDVSARSIDVHSGTASLFPITNGAPSTTSAGSILAASMVSVASASVRASVTAVGRWK